MTRGGRPCRLVAVVVAIALAAACSADDREETVAAVLAADLARTSSFAADLTPEQARCVGDTLVESLGVDEAATLGRADDVPVDEDPDAEFSLEQLADDDVSAIAEALVSCAPDLRSTAVDVVAAGILTDADEAFPVTETEAACVSEQLADGLGLDRLLGIGLSGDETTVSALSVEERVVFARSFTTCVDVRTILLDQVRATGADPEFVDCLDAEISDEDLDTLFIVAYAGSQTSTDEAFARPIAACT